MFDSILLMIHFFPIPTKEFSSHHGPREKNKVDKGESSRKTYAPESETKQDPVGTYIRIYTIFNHAYVSYVYVPLKIESHIK